MTERKPFRRGVTIVGKCYLCRQPIHAGDNAYVRDATVGVDRLTHKGKCWTTLDARIGPK